MVRFSEKDLVEILLIIGYSDRIRIHEVVCKQVLKRFNATGMVEICQSLEDRGLQRTNLLGKTLQLILWNHPKLHQQTKTKKTV